MVQQQCRPDEVLKVEVAFVALWRAYDEHVGTLTEFNQERVDDEADHSTYDKPEHIAVILRVPVE